jgi:hypothetical protein
MLVDDTTSRIALIVWAVTWLPTLALASARVARNDGSVEGDARRFLEAVAALAVPMVAFGLYAWGATERYAAVHGRFDGIGVARSVAAVAVPHAVSVLALSFAARRARRRPGCSACCAASGRSRCSCRRCSWRRSWSSSAGERVSG